MKVGHIFLEGLLPGCVNFRQPFCYHYAAAGFRELTMLLLNVLHRLHVMRAVHASGVMMK